MLLLGGFAFKNDLVGRNGGQAETDGSVIVVYFALFTLFFAPLLTMTGVADRLAPDVKATARAIEQATDDDGLVAFWPKRKGSVVLTAWVASKISNASTTIEMSISTSVKACHFRCAAAVQHCFLIID